MNMSLVTSKMRDSHNSDYEDYSLIGWDGT
jgi:hypothetical protein